MAKSKNKRLLNLKGFKPNVYLSVFGIIALVIGLTLTLVVSQNKQNQRSFAAPAAELLVDKTNQTFTSNGYTSEYHVYASGLDWTKPVGLLLYTDGSGEYGLKNPSQSYLMAGASGMIAVAKKHNMVLVTPFSPNKACSDGDGSCWYLGEPEGYVKWAEGLITSIESQYQIDKRRVAVGGYSSGAEFTMGWWIPSGAAQRTMEDGVLVAISYGGGPYMSEVSYLPAFKSSVHLNWNGGDQDESLTDVKKGNQNYTQAGFQTTMDILPGVTHDRSGEFGAVMDAQITKHVIPATGSVPSTLAPSYVCGGSVNCVPSVSQTVSTAPQNPIVSTAPSLQPQEPEEQISETPDDLPLISPINNPDGGDNQNPQPNGNFLSIILQFFLKLIELFLSLFN